MRSISRTACRSSRQAAARPLGPFTAFRQHLTHSKFHARGDQRGKMQRVWIAKRLLAQDLGSEHSCCGQLAMAPRVAYLKQPSGSDQRASCLSCSCEVCYIYVAFGKRARADVAAEPLLGNGSTRRRASRDKVLRVWNTGSLWTRYLKSRARMLVLVGGDIRALRQRKGGVCECQ